MSADEQFGIECRHHYGITTHEFRPGESVAETVYWLVRNAWHAPKGELCDVLDANHTWEVVEADQADWWSRVRLIKNELAPRFTHCLPWVDDGPGATWFCQEYRIATRGLIGREIADKLAWADRWQADAERQRDTIRGRKARAKYERLSATNRREAELIRSRWPQLDGSGRTEWQARLHEHRVPIPSPIPAQESGR